MISCAELGGRTVEDDLLNNTTNNQEFRGRIVILIPSPWARNTADFGADEVMARDTR